MNCTLKDLVPRPKCDDTLRIRVSMAGAWALGRVRRGVQMKTSRRFGDPTSATRKARGFTLIELMVVVSILAVMGALSVPSLNRLIARHGVTSAGAQMASVISRARVDAMMRGRCVCVMMNQSNSSAAEKFITLRRLKGFDCDSTTLTACDSTDWEPFATGSLTEPPTLVDQSNVRLGAIGAAGSVPSTSLTTNLGLGARFDLVFRPNGRLWSTATNFNSVRWTIRVQHNSGHTEDFLVCSHGATRRATEGC